MTWQDIPTSERPTHHPSTWELEIQQLREQLAALERDFEILGIIRNKTQEEPK